MNENEVVKEVFLAAQINDQAYLSKLLTENADLANQENDVGLTLLGYAAHFGQTESVKILLKFGADVNALSHSKLSFIPSNTALHAAIAGERNLEVIELLLEHGAKTTIMDSNGHSCLHTAAYHDDNTEIIHRLLQYGAQVEQKGPDGKTALDLTIE